MSTPLRGARHRGRGDELPLSEFPAWGLEIMMGLYGPETIKQACADVPADPDGQRPPEPPEAAVRGDSGRPAARDMSPDDGASNAATIDRSVTDRQPTDARRDSSAGAGAQAGGDQDVYEKPLSPLQAEIEAVTAIVDVLGRLFRRR
ncbi:hypothetical protein GCM10009624_12660 [Gordonia sinesedis]